MVTKKCVECGTRHTNKSEESNYADVADICLRCQQTKDYFWLMVHAINSYVPSGEERPRRKIIISEYRIEKV